MIANYLQTNVSVNCLQKVLMSCLRVGELSPKTVSMSCLVDELSRFPFLIDVPHLPTVLVKFSIR